jgi:hypothetical protein
MSTKMAIFFPHARGNYYKKATFQTLSGITWEFWPVGDETT